MTNFASVWQGFVIMIVTILIGFTMSFAGGVILDTIIDAFAMGGFYTVPAIWDPKSKINLLVNLYYFLMYLIPLIGISSFVVTILKRQKYDRFNEWENVP